MPHRGNVYQSVIFAAQQTLDATGELPNTPAALAALSGLDETQISIFKDSLFGPFIKDYLGMMLINTAPGTIPARKPVMSFQ